MTELTLLVALAGLIWAAVFLTRGSLIAGCLGFLVARSVFNVYFGEFGIGPLNASVDRLVFGGLALAFVVQTWLGRSDPKPWQWPDVLLLAFLALLGVSTALGYPFPRVPEGDPFPPARYFAGYLIPAAIYLFARNSRYTERTATLILAGLTGFGVYLALTGLLEAGHQWSLVYPRHIADPEVGIHFGRARGPMAQAVSMGLYLTVTGWAAWLWSRQLSGMARWAPLALLPLSAVSLYYTYTRSCWIGAAAIALLVLIVHTRGVFRWWMLAGVAGLALVVGATKWDSLMGFQRETSSSVTRDSAKLRPMFAHVSWKMFQDRPLLGCGFGQYFEEKNDYLDDHDTELPLYWIRDEAHHNRALNLLVETGLVGLSLFTVFWGTILYKAWRLWHAPRAPAWARTMALLFAGAFAAYGVQILFHDLTYSQQDNALAMLLAGAVVGIEATVLPVTRVRPLAAIANRVVALRGILAPNSVAASS
jgi:O-antigen ligase